MNTYERIYNLLTEASRVRYERPESYGRTRGRKEYGTPGRRGRLTGKTASEMRAYGAGQDAARLIAHAKAKRKAASDIAAGPTVPSAPAAVRALRSGAKHAEERAKKKIAQGKEAVKRKRKGK